jgi:hypothetical protein
MLKRVDELVGLSPQSKKGDRYRVSSGRWDNLAKYIDTIAPEIAQRGEDWRYYRAGAVLYPPDARKLADRLEAEIESGRALQHVQAHQFEPCGCEGGVDRHGDWCEECDGSGKQPTLFRIEDVQNLLTFLRASTGFVIVWRWRRVNAA